MSAIADRAEEGLKQGRKRVHLAGPRCLEVGAARRSVNRRVRSAQGRLSCQETPNRSLTQPNRVLKP